MADKKPTEFQDEVNNHIIAVKKRSDKHPGERAAFTVLVDLDGNLNLVTKLSPYAVRMIAEELCNAQRREPDEKIN